MGVVTLAVACSAVVFVVLVVSIASWVEAFNALLVGQFVGDNIGSAVGVEPGTPRGEALGSVQIFDLGTNDVCVDRASSSWRRIYSISLACCSLESFISDWRRAIICTYVPSVASQSFSASLASASRRARQERGECQRLVSFDPPIYT